jgi:hypothetical protein
VDRVVLIVSSGVITPGRGTAIGASAAGVGRRTTVAVWVVSCADASWPWARELIISGGIRSLTGMLSVFAAPRGKLAGDAASAVSGATV